MSPSAQRIVQLLAGTPTGLTRVEIADLLGLTVKHVQNLTSMLDKSEAIAAVTVGGGPKDHHTKRYYALEHKPAHVERAAPRPFRRPRRAAPCKYVPRPKPKGAVFIGEPIITSETKVTICPPFVDRRFEFNFPPGWKGQISLDSERRRRK